MVYSKCPTINVNKITGPTNNNSTSPMPKQAININARTSKISDILVPKCCDNVDSPEIAH